jgi:hypothetical protein
VDFLPSSDGEKKNVAPQDGVVTASMDVAMQESGNSTVQVPAPPTPHGLESYTVFFGAERASHDGPLELTVAAKGGLPQKSTNGRVPVAALDARTASTLAMLRRDIGRDVAYSDNALESVFIKPRHDAWVCASVAREEDGTGDNYASYVVIDDNADTLLKVVRSVKTFASAAIPDLDDAAFDVGQ